MPDLFELAAQARALVADVEALNTTNTRLAERVAANTAQAERQGRRIARAEKLATRTAVFVALLAVLAGLLGFLMYQQFTTSAKLEQVVAAERESRQKGQCPVLAVFLGSYDPDSRLAGDARRKYEDAYVRFRQAYADLQCAQITPVVPPRTDQTPPPR